MKLGTFIPGGRDSYGQFVQRFIIRDRHTVFEWVMIYTDRHPQPGQTDGFNVEDMRVRGVFLGITSTDTLAGRGPRSQLALRKIANAVYCEIVAEISAGRIIPLKRAYCADAPERLDMTQCVIAADDVLGIARRRRDGGYYIKTLLANHSVLAETIDEERPAQPAPKAKRHSVTWGKTHEDWWQEYRQECDATGVRPSANQCEAVARKYFDGRVHRPTIRKRYAALPDEKKAPLGHPRKSAAIVGDNKSAADLPK